MRSLKKIAVTSLLSVSMLTATNVVSYNQSNHSIQFGYQKVLAAEDMPDAMKSALKTISGVGQDGTPILSTDERNAVKDLIENPKKYVDAKTGDELLNLVNEALDRPAVLAKAGSHEIDKDTILGNLRNELSKAKTARGTATTGVDGKKDDKKRDLSDLTANESYSTLYASVIYSLSKGESADSASISLNQLSKYPVQDGNGQNQQYGALATPSLTTPKNPIGSQLASYIQTLHDYNYLVMKDKTGFSGIWNTLTGWASQAVRNTLLATAMLGAILYDFSTFFINAMTNAFTKFNILKVTGISAGAEAANTLVENLLSGVLNIFGLTGETIRLLQYSLYTILLAMFVLKIITQLNKAKAKQAVKTTKLTMLRVFTIIMTIPVTAMMYGVSSTLFDSLKNAATDASRISDSYVINVTKWAGTLNLSLDPMGTSAVSSSTSGVKADKKFEPTPSNIAKLNSAIRAVDDANAEKSDNKQRNAQLAMTAISNLMEDKEASVQSYFNYIAANGQSGSNMAAEALPNTAASDAQTGRSNAYLYVSRDKKEDALGKLKSLLGLGDKKTGEADDEAGKSYSYDVNGKTIAITPASKADLVPVAWNNPTSYLYGAVPPGNLTTSTLNHANYHLSAYTNMLNDPKTDEVASDEELKQALVKNAQNFALINKYAGIKGYGGENPALSSQSVAFLLQSKVSNGSINYKGYNTAANEAGSSKNTGAYGITYVENVVPSNGVADYMGKIASLNAIWVAAGYTAFIVMLTLLKSPILGAIVRHLKGFFQALFVGDTIGLLESITFYLALSSSFVFGYLGILFGTSLIQQLIGEGSVASALSFVSLIPIYGPILISWIVAFILTWPVVSLSLGRSGKRRKAGIVELVVAMPYLMAESLDPAFDIMYSRLYGKSRSQTFGAKLANKAQAVDPGTVLKDNLKKGAGLALTGIQAAGSAIPGYGTAAAAAAGVMKGVINGKGGMDADPNDPNTIVPSTGNGFIDGAARLGLGLAKDKLDDDKNTPLDAERDVSMIEYDEHGNPIERDTVTGLPIKGNDPSKEHYGDLSSTGNASEIDGTIPVDSQTPQEQAVDDSQAKLDEIAKNTQALKDKDGNDIVIDPNDPNAQNEPLEVEDPELKVPEIKDPEVDQLRDPKLENADQLHDVNVENAEDLKDVNVENADQLHDVDLANADKLRDVNVENADDLKDVDLHNTDQLHDVDVTDADKLRDINVENTDQLHDLGIDDTDKLHIDTPNIDPLNVNDPDLHIDEPNIETPEIKPVDVNDPAIEIPEVKPLDVNNPDLHIDDPKIETPEIKPVDMNDPKIEIPDIKPLDVNDPAITAPDLRIDDPKIETPELKADLTGQPEIKIPEMKDVTATVTNPAQQAAPEVKIPEMKDVTATVTNPSQTVTAPVQEGPTIINNQTTNQTGPAGTTTPTPPQSAGPQNVKVDLAGFSHQGKDFQFDPSKVEIKMPDRKPENFDAMRSFSRGKQEAKDLTKQTVNAVIDGASASVIGQTIASAVAPLGDQIKAAKTGQPVETVRQERIIEQAAKQEARETQIVRDSVEKQITKEILIKENMSRGMSADQAESFAKVQQGIANIATSPLGKLAGAMAKPMAFAADRAAFGDKNVMQNILNGKRPEGLDKKTESHAYESKSYQDRRNEERMMDTLDRIADNMERDRDRY